MPYHDRLKSLGLYSLQRRREWYCIIYIIWKIVDCLAPKFLTLLQVHFLHVGAGHATFTMSMWVALVLWSLIVLDDVQWFTNAYTFDFLVFSS